MLMKSKDGNLAARLAGLLKEATTECPSCGAAVPKGDGFCPECGKEMAGGMEKAAASLDRLRGLHKALGELIGEGGEMSEVEKAEEDRPEDELLKAVPPAVRDLIVKERAEREELAKELAGERTRRETEEAISKAASWGNLGIDASEFGPVLRQLRNLDAEVAKAVEDVLDGAQKVTETSDLFRVIGKSSSGTSTDKLDALTRAHLEKNADLSYAQAQAAVLETPEGAAAYRDVAASITKGV